MKDYIKHLSGILFILIIAGCGDGGGVASNKKYLAKNIILDSVTVSKAYASEIDPDIDAVTKIPAANVVFEKSEDSNLVSENVQEALEELSLMLKNIIPGTWDIENINNEQFHSDSGKIIINDDGTFDLVEGSFAAIGMGSGDVDDGMGGMCNHKEEDQTYEFFTEEVVLFRHVDRYNASTAIPQLIKIKKNEVTFLGSGGCGVNAQQRISILTRVDE